VYFLCSVHLPKLSLSQVTEPEPEQEDSVEADPNADETPAEAVESEEEEEEEELPEESFDCGTSSRCSGLSFIATL